MKNYIFTKKMKDGTEHLIHKQLESKQKAIDHAEVFRLNLVGVENEPELDKNDEPIWNIN